MVNRRTSTKTIDDQYSVSISEVTTMTTVNIEMKPFSGEIDLGKAAVIIIDMQVSPVPRKVCV